MREGPAVDHSDDLAPGDAAAAHEVRRDHVQCQHECMPKVREVEICLGDFKADAKR